VENELNFWAAVWRRGTREFAHSFMRLAKRCRERGVAPCRFSYTEMNEIRQRARCGPVSEWYAGCVVWALGDLPVQGGYSNAQGRGPCIDVPFFTVMGSRFAGEQLDVRLYICSGVPG